MKRKNNILTSRPIGYADKAFPKFFTSCIMLAVVLVLVLNMDLNLDVNRTLKEDFTTKKWLYAGQMVYHTSSLLMNCTKKVSGSPLLVCKE